MSPTGISSMKRTCHGWSSVSRAKSTDLVVVDAAHHDHVELDRIEARRSRGVRPRDRIEAEIAPRDRRDAIGAQAVDADVDAVEPALREASAAISGRRTPFVESAMSSISGDAAQHARSDVAKSADGSSARRR